MYLMRILTLISICFVKPIDFVENTDYCFSVPVCSGYCMQEFDISYHHNILVKRKKRLVILMALDNPNDIYANDASDTAALRQYLRQYTYIDYTADDWLDKLLYALPLRGLLQRDQNDVMECSEQPENLPNNDELLMDLLLDEQHPSFNGKDTELLLLE